MQAAAGAEGASSISSPAVAPEAAPMCLEPGSYRDRNGAIFYREGRVFRAISAKALRDWEHLRTTTFFRTLTEEGRIVATERAAVDMPESGEEPWAGVLSHDRIAFVSYPYEWPFGMLKDAALLHLRLMRAALAEGMILKDASPYNIQWNGAEPVFIDIPSFEILGSGEPWIGYRQFCELFLYPLMLQAYKGVDFRPWLRGSLDGIPAAPLRRLMATRDLLRPGVLMHVAAQAALQRRYAGERQSVRSSLAQAGFDKRMIERNVDGLRRIVERMEPVGGDGAWADYARTHSYEPSEFEAKRAFVREAAARRRWRLAWDLGCNTGTFSRIAADHADTVVAMDADAPAVEHLYRSLKNDPLRPRVLPLVNNLADPSPGQGWQGAERRSLSDRGRPELTLCLALIHHMVIGANIPMRSFVGWLADLGTALVIEFVGRDDEMVARLLANRDDQYGDYHESTFERLLAERFEIAARQPLKGGKRAIYLAFPRSG